MLIHILTGCAVSPAFPCSPVSISSVVCCFVLSASSRVGLGDVESRTKNCWIWFWVHIKGSLKEEKKWRSCPANCLKDVLKRGMKRLTLLQGALVLCHLQGLRMNPKSCIAPPSGSITVIFLCCALVATNYEGKTVIPSSSNP